MLAPDVGRGLREPRDPVTRYNPGLGHTNVLIGFWAASLPAESGAMRALLIGVSAVVGLIAGIRHLYQNMDEEMVPLSTIPLKFPTGTSRRFGQPILSAIPGPHADRRMKKQQD